MNSIDPVSLRLFIRIVEAGTIAAAAQAENLSAAAVSKRISELEEDLRTPLLMRTNKGTEPTGAGLALLKLARSALAELDQVKVQMGSYASGVRGLVRVCATMSVITQFLASPLRSFLSAHPEVQIQLEERTSPLVAKAVAENAADLGIYLPIGAGPTDLVEFDYMEDRLAVVVSPSHPLAAFHELELSQLLEHDIVGLSAGSAINVELTRAALETRRALKIRIQVTSFDALCIMVSTGLGVGLMPEGVATRNAKIVPLHIAGLKAPWSRRQFKICARKHGTLPGAAQLLLEHLVVEASVKNVAASSP